MPCDCCGGTFVDEVGLILVLEAAHAYRDELRAKAARDRAAWDEAQRVSAQALVEARKR